MGILQKKKQIIAIAGGGTAGHIMPALAVAKVLCKKNEVLFLVSSNEDILILKNSGFPAQKILSGKLRRYFDLKNLFDPFKVVAGILQSISILKSNKVSLLFCKGGFVSLPPAIAAKFLHIPIVLHESDSIPGMANQIIGRFANKICVGFNSTKKYFPKAKVVFTGNPVREEFLDTKLHVKSLVLNKKLGLDSSKKTLLIVGGSQGAEALNEIVFNEIEGLLRKYNLLHITGKNNIEKAKEVLLKTKIKTNVYLVYPYLSENIALYMDLADLIISRAGAGAISEIIALGKPSILVPLPQAAQDHQRSNANEYAIIGATKVVEENQLKGNMIKYIGEALLKQNYNKMKLNLKKIQGSNAVLDISKTIQGILNENNDIRWENK